MQQSLDIEPSEEEKKEKLEDDYSTPFSPPQGEQDLISKDHQNLDTGIDEHEWYDEGRQAASMDKSGPTTVDTSVRPKEEVRWQNSHGPVRIIKHSDQKEQD